MDLTLEASYITLLLNRLGRRKDTSLRESALDEMNMAKRRLEKGRFLPWFLGKWVTEVIAAAQETYTLPADFLAEEEDTQILLTGGEVRSILKKGTHDVLEKKYGVETGTPRYYSVVGGSLYFWPIPATEVSMRFYYMAAQPDFVDTATAVTNPWLLNASDWLLAEAGTRIAGFHIMKPDLAKLMASAAAEAKDNIMVVHEARKHVNTDYTDDSEYL